MTKTVKLATTSKFPIRKGVAMPSPWRGKTAIWDMPEYSFIKEMKVTDSVYVGDDKKFMSAIETAMRKFGKLNNRTFAFRKEGKGRAVWRIK